MNNTKWEELRQAMSCLGPDSPRWRTKTMGSGCLSEWDGDWFYHFQLGGYADIEWVEIRIKSDSQKERVLAALKQVHVPGFATESGYKVVGYAEACQTPDYL